MRIIECKQYSPEWWEARRGIPTASAFDRIITAKTGKFASGSESYIYELLAEKVRLDPPVMTEGPTTPAMKEGLESEPEARKWFAFHTDKKVREVGFIISDDNRFGCSPDGLVSDDAVLELKCPQGKKHVEYLLGGKVPDEYKAQCHGQMIVTGLKRCYFVSYCLGFDPLLVEVTPDEYTDALRVCLEQFWIRFNEQIARLTKGVGK